MAMDGSPPLERPTRKAANTKRPARSGWFSSVVMVGIDCWYLMIAEGR